MQPCQHGLQVPLLNAQHSGNKDVVQAALDLVWRLPELTADPNKCEIVGEAFRMVNARLFLRFQQVQAKKRKLNKLVGGTITLGACPPSIAIYQGPTARATTKGSATCCAA